ncbi:hypothetical protein LIER_38660 [Lithospermum erythrorhizon]|uniref:Helitron helicase-like domain-containing protein n=1 Tax=Lithospermum erythrorhizon TaxID=34254 RepID=A0AAV3Q5I2_LITER
MILEWHSKDPQSVLQRVLSIVQSRDSSWKRVKKSKGNWLISLDWGIDSCIIKGVDTSQGSPGKYYESYKFYRKTDFIYCSKGEIVLAESILPPYLVLLITGTYRKSKEIQNMIRTYNNHFAFTSIGISCDERYQHRDHGVYTVRVQDQIHHYLNDLMPQDASKKLSGIQFYFYDPEHQVSNRMATLPRLDVTIVERLVKLMEPNPYSEFLKHASSLDNIKEYHIVIRLDPGLDQKTYNRPTFMEVAGIWIEDESGETNNKKHWEIKVYTKSGRSRRVKYYYGCYDPLQYMLIFPNGEPGWHCNIPRAGCRINKNKSGLEISSGNYSYFEDLLTRERQGFNGPGIDSLEADDDDTPSTNNKRRKRKSVTCREYYMYKLQDRPNDTSYILRFGRLFQQYIVDNYIKIETMRRLDFLKNNQKKTRQEHYQGVINSVIRSCGWRESR